MARMKSIHGEAHGFQGHSMRVSRNALRANGPLFPNHTGFKERWKDVKCKCGAPATRVAPRGRFGAWCTKHAPERLT